MFSPTTQQDSGSILTNKEAICLNHRGCCRYQLITPLHSDQWKKSILVNRGWVPATWRSDPKIRQPWDTNEEVELEAVIRGDSSPHTWSMPVLSFATHFLLYIFTEWVASGMPEQDIKLGPAIRGKLCCEDCQVCFGSHGSLSAKSGKPGCIRQYVCRACNGTANI